MKYSHMACLFHNSVHVFIAADMLLNLVVLVEPLCHLNCSLRNS